MSDRPRIGTEVAGYDIERVLGRGGMSIVYLARHTTLGRRVALKILATELADDDRFRERFVRESRIAAGLDHPTVIPIYDAGESGGVLFIAMRYVDGTDLKSLIKTSGPLEVRETMLILGQAGSALDSAHERGLVHRDVKPANILIDRASESGEIRHVYLSDFGLVKHAASTSGITGTGQFVGTVDYVSPEQIQGEPVDHRADIYAFGCVLYECLAGSVPYPREDDVAKMWAHVHGERPSLAVARPDLALSLDPILGWAMSLDPTARPPSCAELLAEVRRAVVPAESEPEPGPEPVIVEPTRPSERPPDPPADGQSGGSLDRPGTVPAPTVDAAPPAPAAGAVAGISTVAAATPLPAPTIPSPPPASEPASPTRPAASPAAGGGGEYRPTGTGTSTRGRRRIVVIGVVAAALVIATALAVPALSRDDPAVVRSSPSPHVEHTTSPSATSSPSTTTSTSASPGASRAPVVLDVLPPTNPRVLSSTPSSVTLIWERAPHGDRVDHFVLYRDGEVYADDLTERKFTDGDVVPGTRYVYVVRAVGVGGTSADSEPLPVVVPVATTPAPSTPTSPSDGGGGGSSNCSFEDHFNGLC